MPIIDLSSEIFNIQDVIANSLFGTNKTSLKAARVPMSFTSTRRLRLINENFDKDIRRLRGAANTIQSISQLASDVGIASEVQTVQSDLPVIQMGVNPASISWRQPKRITKKDTQEGSIFFHFTNARGQNNDILVLDFKGNTGNINLAGDTAPAISGVGALGATGSDTGAVKKLIAWHNLWNLTRETMILDDGVSNEFMITYTSAAIPFEIMLIGFFSANLEWEDNASKPNSKDYSFSFTVQEIVPDIDDLVKNVSTFTSDITAT